MNILIEGGNLNPIAEGTRNIAISYAKKLKERGHNVIVLTKQIDRVGKMKYKKVSTEDGIKFYRWSNYCDKFYKHVEGGKKIPRGIYNFLKLINYLEFYLTYKKILEKENIDISQVFLKGLRPRMYYNSLKFLNKCPLIVTLLGDPSFNYIKYNPKKDFNNIDLIIVTSKTVYNHMKNLGVKNLKYLSYGIDVKRFIPSKKSKNNKIKKIYCSRYYDRLSELTRSLKKINNEEKIKIIAGKVMNSELSHGGFKNKELEKATKNIVYIGVLKKIEALFKKIDIMIDLHRENKYITSASPPAKILEAMSSGVVVISTNLPEMREVITDGKNGFLIKEGSSKEIYKKIKQALNSNKDIGKNARKTILEKFNLNKSIIEYENIYKSLIKK